MLKTFQKPVQLIQRSEASREGWVYQMLLCWVRGINQPHVWNEGGGLPIVGQAGGNFDAGHQDIDSIYHCWQVKQLQEERGGKLMPPTEDTCIQMGRAGRKENT